MTTVILKVISDVNIFVLFVCWLVSFAMSFVLVYVTLEYFVLDELYKLEQLIKGINKKEYKKAIVKAQRPSTFINPFSKISKELLNFAYIKQEEVEKLKKLETYRREFLADISHEFKTPLFSAQGYVHTLLDGAMDDVNVREKFLKKAAKSLDGLNLLVQDLLLLSQIETGELKMHFSSFNISKLINDVVEQLEHKAEKKQIRFVLNFSDNIIVLGDKVRIYQVIVNLVDNAIKYGGDEISIQSVKNKENYEFSFKDNGPGIPQEHLKRIFDRFYRIEKSRNKEKGGTGLGLSIVKNVLDAHNSKIQVSSETGKGTIFTFKLKKGNIEEVSDDD